MLKAQEIIRYEKHIDLPLFGEEKQILLINKTVTVIGAGGLGCPVMLYLAASGVGKINIIDDDLVSLSNLQRQILYTKDDLKRNKVNCSATFLQKLNPEININPVFGRLEKDNMLPLIKQSDLIIDASDNFDTRYLLNSLSVENKIPLLSGAILHYDGQVCILNPTLDKNPCYACLYPRRPEIHEVPSCSDSAVFSPVAGVIGTIMATEAIKHLLQIGSTLNNKIIFYSSLSSTFYDIEINKSKNCKICNIH